MTHPACTRLFCCLVAILASSSACDAEDGEGEDGTAAPAAPEELEASVVAGGAHLTWIDASDDEDEFSIERRPADGDFVEVATVPFDTIQYHDESGGTGTWIYRVLARSASGESASAEVSVEIP